MTACRTSWTPHYELGGGYWAGDAGQWVIGEKYSNDAYTSMYYSTYIHPDEWSSNASPDTYYTNGDNWFYINQPWNFSIMNGGGQFFAGEEDITQGFEDIGVDITTGFSL